MTTISHSPLFPAPNKAVAVSFALTNSSANFIRVWCTVAPTGSNLEKLINDNKDPRNRIVFFEGSPSTVLDYQFDKGGKYTFVCQEYVKGSGYGGGYEGDPNGNVKETKLGSEISQYIYIGQKVTQPIGPPSNQATLTLWVWNDTIRRTTKAFHGEDSPSIIAASPTARVKAAIESETVQDALDFLIDKTATVAAGNVATKVLEIWTAIAEHYANAGAHPVEIDVENVLVDGFSTAYSNTELPKFVNQVLKSLIAHYTNDGGVDGSGVYGPDSQPYHKPSLEIVNDRLNIPVYQSVSKYDEAYGALADIQRSLSAHTLDSTVHGFVEDSGLTALSPIWAVHSAFCSEIASTNPSVAPAQSTGVHTLISTAGFKES
jgi:hypothetical protein